MSYKLSERQLEEIAKLPIEIQYFKDKYPISISNVALASTLPTLTRTNVVKSIEIYFGDDTEEADWFIRDGVTERFDEREPHDVGVIRIKINGEWAYIQLEEREVFNRLGDIELPGNLKDITLQVLHIN